MPGYPHHPPTEFPYNIHVHILESVDSAKYLSLNIHKSLSWNKQIDSTMMKKANSTIAFISRITSARKQQKTFATRHLYILSIEVYSVKCAWPSKYQQCDRYTAETTVAKLLYKKDKLWNALPQEVVDCPSQDIFRFRLQAIQLCLMTVLLLSALLIADCNLHMMILFHPCTKLTYSMTLCQRCTCTIWGGEEKEWNRFS